MYMTECSCTTTSRLTISISNKSTLLLKEATE